MLGNGRVLEYVIVDESVTYSGHSSLFVGNTTGGLKELGPVPCLAITKDLNTGEIARQRGPCEPQAQLAAC